MTVTAVIVLAEFGANSDFVEFVEKVSFLCSTDTYLEIISEIMKFAIPEISWHNRDPVLSVDFQPKADNGEPTRLATGGTDSHVLIWYITATETGSVNLEVAADLTRHQKAVNVVRWSPNGQFLASGDDESIIFIWKKADKEPATASDQSEEQYKESWIIHKTLRGHMEDVLDISWSSDSLHLASGSVDNKLLIWDISKGKYSSILTDHKGFVQGVSWDPKGQLIASASTDRVFRTFDVATKKVTSRSNKAILPFPSDHPLHNVKVRLYHDDTLQTYFRRLQFSPDGMLVAVPGGKIEPEQGKVDLKPINAVYIYTRYSLKTPVCVVPCGEAALVARWSPRRYGARAGGAGRGALGLARRLLLAVGTRRSVLLYDTHQRTPVALLSNVHYTRLTDLTWSPDGCTLVASSTDGYCSVITFRPGELGEVVPEHMLTEPTATAAEPMEVEANETLKEDKQNNLKAENKVQKEKPEQKERKEKPINRLDSFVKFKAPGERSPKRQKTEPQQKTPIKIDVLEEVAMPSWSDNSNNEIIKPKEIDQDSEITVIDDSQEIKLIYEDTEGAKSASKSPEITLPPNAQKTTPGSDVDKSNIPKRGPSSALEQVNTLKSSENMMESSNFLKQAKVRDVKEAVAAQTAASPKAPRRVTFVTLSSPKNAKKK